MNRRGRPSSGQSSAPGCQIPIVDHRLQIVGWTAQPPEFRDGALHHPEAERLVGDPIEPIYVEIYDAADARRAGAPAGWTKPWRCLALANQRTAAAWWRFKEAPIPDAPPWSAPPRSRILQ